MYDTEYWYDPALEIEQEDVQQSRGPFLESPGNFSGPKSNIQIEI